MKYFLNVIRASVFQCGHSDAIYDMKFLDDEFLISGSIDCSLSLWQIKDSDLDIQFDVDSTSNQPKTPNMIRSRYPSEEIRALAVNHTKREFGSLSLSGHITLWDIKRMIAKSVHKLRFPHAAACMSHLENSTIFAVGSESHVSLFDSREKKSVTDVFSKHIGWGK